ncbi:PPK2 family polyphosphate kinase [Caenimonas koreensis]|uniref:Polyphosphate--nucleotide phosphotransferase n=1 Tax=Caenimonas koreensis DSM 17982 TaxID=1121255 RepID=A0A844AT37_9BURK|nr:PPK2 family polyphosphate kinase [Caenimonas koreensis]MRD47630.1 polyphosphate--nucleotide phosphotransferase [Caenimonas koreensis DSM 17982]
MPHKSATTLDSKRLRPWLVASPSSKPWPLELADPSAQPFSSGNKSRDKDEVRKIADDIDVLQDTLFADRRFRVLVVLQGMDAAGKDGTVRGVFGEVSPLGVRTMSWKAPTPEERDHDFLWRIHQHVPASGELMIFNRSHYEDVLVPVVNGDISAATTLDRYRQINDFERLLTETGTVILKFMLHISRDEQRKRLQARLDEPAKGWKFMPRDLEVRAQWPAYMKAYEALLGATGTAIAPWIVVPSNSKTHRNLMIGTIVRERLKLLGLRYPPRDPRFDGLKVS